MLEQYPSLLQGLKVVKTDEATLWIRNLTDNQAAAYYDVNNSGILNVNLPRETAAKLAHAILEALGD